MHKNRISGNVNTGEFKREIKILLTILLIFECSYLFRFLLEFFWYDINRSHFLKIVLADLAYIFDGLSFIALLSLHFKNFKRQGDNLQQYQSQASSSLNENTATVNVLVSHETNDCETSIQVDEEEEIV